MSTEKTGRSQTTENHNPLIIKVNDILIDELNTKELKLVSQEIPQIASKIKSELIHRSQDPNKDKKSISESINEKTIKITISSGDIVTTEVDWLVSPEFTRLLNRRFWAVKLLLRFVTNLNNAELLKSMSAILPALFFSICTLILLLFAGRISNGVIWGSIILGFFSFFISVKLFRFFSEIKRYALQEQIKKNHSLRTN